MSDTVSPTTGLVLKRGERSLVLTYKGMTRTVAMPGWYGDDDDDAIHSGEDLSVSDRALAEMKVEADRLLSPAEIRRIRHALRLSQKDAGEVIGGGPKAFQKYESGEVAPSRAIANALRLLERHPEEIEFLKTVTAA